MSARSDFIRAIVEEGITAARRYFGTALEKSIPTKELERAKQKFKNNKKDETARKNNAEKKADKKRNKSNTTQLKKTSTKNDQEGAANDPETGRSVSAAREVESGQAGKVTRGSSSVTNFIKDQMAMSPGMQARSKQDKEFAKMIRNAKTKKEKEALQEALNKIREKRRRADAKQAATTARKSAQTRTGQTRPRRTDYVTQDGEIIGKPTAAQIRAALRNFEARDETKNAKRMRDALEELRGVETGKGQVQPAGVRTIDTSDRMIQDAKKSLVAVFGQKKGTELFNKILRRSNTKREFLVEIRSMVRGGSQGQSTGTRPSETGAIVGNRKSNLQLVDRSANKQPGRREVTSRRGKPGNSELDAPMNRGGKVTKRMKGAHDFRMNKGGLLLSSVERKKKK